MSYSMSMMDSCFFIAKENIDNVFKVIKELSNGNHAWVSTIPDSANIHDAFHAWRWEVYKDVDGNISEIDFEGTKLGDDEILFRAIAPFVKEGSYLQMLGEENCMWRWIFSEGKMYELTANITWV